jgi:hypothetical protein
MLECHGNNRLQLTIGLQLAMQARFNNGRPAVSVPRGTQMTEVRSLKPTTLRWLLH